MRAATRGSDQPMQKDSRHSSEGTCRQVRVFRSECTRKHMDTGGSGLMSLGEVRGRLGLTLPPLPSSPALPSVLINIRTSVQTVVVGHAVEFECLALGDPKPQVTWSKVGGRLRPGIVQSGGIVRIAHVELADAGQYRCTATNAAGTTQSHVLLLVQGGGQQGPPRGQGASPGKRTRSCHPLGHLL